MTVVHLGMGYLAVGTLAALYVLRNAQPAERASAVADAGLLVVCWPIYAPFLWIREPEVNSPLARALRLARAGHLASILPDEAAAGWLESRLLSAAERAKELDALLAEPDFCPERTRARVESLRATGREAAAAAAERNLNQIRRLCGLRDRHAAELDEILELMRQLRAQAEFARLAGAGDGDTRTLVQALMVRVEGLDAVLEDELVFPQRA